MIINNTSKILFTLIIGSLFFGGCSSKNYAGQECAEGSWCSKIKNNFNEPDNEREYFDNKELNSARLPYKPIISSRNSDSRVLMDQGVVLKAWINTYKTSSGSLQAAHDVYIRVKEPDFVVNYEVPPKIQKNRGLFNQAIGKTPFVYGNDELDRSNIETNEAIVDYTNSIEENKKEGKQQEQVEKADKFDDEIKNFLESRKR